jgi:hypothetical protein
MSKLRATGLVLMAVSVCAYGAAPDWLAVPDWLAMLIGLLGLAATLIADCYYLKFAIARRQLGFLIDRAMLVAALGVLFAIYRLR